MHERTNPSVHPNYTEMLYRLAETVRVRTPPLVRDAQATWIGWVRRYAAISVTTEKLSHWDVALLKVYKAH